eukprot:jgi/Botrbrau1/14451/Bobra.0014s0096.1
MLRGKVAIVTGASRGIGKAISLAFAREGATMIITATNKDSLQEVTESIKAVSPEGNYETHALDLSDTTALDTLIGNVLESHKAIDVLVNNAGMASSSHPLEGDPDKWEKMIALNVLAPMRLTHHVGKHMVERGSGCIINIDSVAGINAIGSHAAYVASKHAITGWTESVAQARMFGH